MIFMTSAKPSLLTFPMWAFPSCCHSPTSLSQVYGFYLFHNTGQLEGQWSQLWFHRCCKSRSVSILALIKLSYPISADVEAFDEALDRRIWSLADTRLQWHKRMAKTRREVPSEIQTRMSSLFAKGQEQDQIISQLSEDDTMEGEEPLEGRPSFKAIFRDMLMARLRVNTSAVRDCWRISYDIGYHPGAWPSVCKFRK